MENPPAFFLPSTNYMDKKFVKAAIKAVIAQICSNFIIVFIASAISYGCCKFLTHGAEIDMSRLVLLHESIVIFFIMTLLTVHHVNEYTKEKHRYADQKIIVYSYAVHAVTNALILIAAILYAHYY